MKRIMLLVAAFAAALSFNAFGAADKGTPDEAQALVKRAVAFYQKNGRDKSIAEFRNDHGAFVDRDLYVTLYDMQGNCLSQINPRMIGKNMMELRDQDGIYIVKERVEGARKSDSGWQEYKFFNPATKRVEPKRVYWEKHDKLIFATGAYK